MLEYFVYVDQALTPPPPTWFFHEPLSPFAVHMVYGCRLPRITSPLLAPSQQGHVIYGCLPCVLIGSIFNSQIDEDVSDELEIISLTIEDVLFELFSDIDRLK